MKKWCLFLSLYFCICLLAACAGGDISAGEGADSGGAPAEETQSGGETAEPGRVTETFRLVTAGDSDDPASVLAAVNGTSGDVYTLDIFSVEDVTLEGYTQEETAAMDWSPMPGALVEVTWDGSVMESYPARFGDVTSVRILESGFNDLCRLYLDVLEDLWNVDAGLNEGITELGVDLSETSLPESERAAVAYAFGMRHGLMPVEGTYGELVEAGYIDGENLTWEDGCLFSIKETQDEDPVVFSLPAFGSGDEMPDYNGVRFDAEKWRSGTGAYFFSDCTAVQNGGGQWGDYAVGAEAIS